ncbi:MAG: hypothetical protein CMH03_10530 [Marinovum sp.]|nr:hypothetical protein [Marinovum sp.]|tara:strand:- start:3373 stop:3609 length:237 start_codon:yes stop_codon:yes gene_type:complete
MALTVSSIVENTSGFVANDKYNALSPALKDAVKVLIESLDGVDWSNPQDLKDIIETKVTEVATSEGVEASDLTAYFSE